MAEMRPGSESADFWHRLQSSLCSTAYLLRQHTDTVAGRKSTKSTYSTFKKCLACQDVLASISKIPVLANGWV